jgi:hypothetical protein
MSLNLQLINDIDSDDIFARPPRAVARAMAERTARITCRVCNQQAQVALDNDALICPGCRTDVDATKKRVQAQRDAWQAKQYAADAALAQLQTRHTDFWLKIIEARATGRPGTDAKAYAAHPTYAALLDAERACQALQAERDRLDRAMEEMGRI